MKQIYLTLLMSFFLITSILANDYYVSSSDGNDKNNGSKEKPFKSLIKISKVKLKPGDQVLFKRGDVFKGHFVVNGSGNAKQQIVISSYGEGALPILTGAVGEERGGDFQEAILVRNNDHITFENIEIQNERNVAREGVKDKNAYGILILNNKDASVLKHFRFKGVTFRNVYAALPVKKEEGETAFNNLEVAALTFLSTRNNVKGQEKNIQDVIMEDCYFNNLQRLGVHIKHAGGKTKAAVESMNYNKDFIFRNNKFEHLGGTCILPIRTYDVLIEKNIFEYIGDNSDPRMAARGSTVWTWRCVNTVIQYNKCLHIRGYLDSHGVHIDHENKNTFIQYNYMEDCEGGFVEILGGNINSVYRYNVSVNDGWRANPNWKTSNHTIWINNKIPRGTHECDSSYIYNNTIIMDSDESYATSLDMKGKNTYIFNNIFYVKTGSVGQKQTTIQDYGSTFFVSNNLYFGKVSPKFTDHDQDPINGNPKFIDNDYSINKKSPAYRKGIVKLGPPIPGAGKGVFKDVPEYPLVDFNNQKIDYTKGVSIGAYNGNSSKKESK